MGPLAAGNTITVVLLPAAAMEVAGSSVFVCATVEISVSVVPVQSTWL